jgi:hypothetical protein
MNMKKNIFCDLLGHRWAMLRGALGLAGAYLRQGRRAEAREALAFAVRVLAWAAEDLRDFLRERLP